MNYWLITREIADILSIYGVSTFTRTQGGATEYYVENWPAAVDTVNELMEADEILDNREIEIQGLLADFDAKQFYRSTESLSPYTPY